MNPVLNAVVQDRFKEAQQEANDVDDYIAANAKNMEMIENEKPLLGVPFTVKESCGLKGNDYIITVSLIPYKVINLQELDLEAIVIKINILKNKYIRRFINKQKFTGCSKY